MKRSSTSEAQRVKHLGREVKELRRANELLELASAFFAPGRVRPPTEVLKNFIDEHRDAYGVELICKMLRIAPSGYWRQAALAREPHRR